jgi:hypothetical protein
MDSALDSALKRIARLEVRTSRLRLWAYLLWPVLWIGSMIACFGMTRADEEATRVFLKWLQSGFVGLVVVLLGAMVVGFLLKTVSDFRQRGQRFMLNPGSRRE